MILCLSVASVCRENDDVYPSCSIYNHEEAQACKLLKITRLFLDHAFARDDWWQRVRGQPGNLTNVCWVRRTVDEYSPGIRYGPLKGDALVNGCRINSEAVT